MTVTLSHHSSPNPPNQPMPVEEETTTVTCGTTKGDIVFEFHRHWSPHGYDKVVSLFEAGYYDHSHFFRVIPGFLVQFGITYNKELKAMGRQTIPDDPKPDPPIEFHPGIVSFAGSGPNSRNSQIFISYGSAPSLGRELWETPVGKVVEGLEHANEFYSYGDMPPWGKGPEQQPIHGGPAYIEENFPLTDRFTTCHVQRPIEERELAEDGGAPEDSQLGDISDVAPEETIELPKVHKPQHSSEGPLRKTALHKHVEALKEKMPTDADLSVVIAVVFLLLFLCGVALLRRGNKKASGKDS